MATVNPENKPVGAGNGHVTAGEPVTTRTVVRAEGVRTEVEGNRAGGVEDQRSITKHLSDLTSETFDLVRKEIELAKAEASEKIDQAKQGAIAVATGGAVLTGGLLILMAAVVLIVGLIMPMWLSALLVGLVGTIVGAVLLAKGKSDLNPKNMTPDRTVDELQRDKRMVKEHV